MELCMVIHSSPKPSSGDNALEYLLFTSVCFFRGFVGIGNEDECNKGARGSFNFRQVS